MDNIKLNFEYPGLKLDKRQISELLFSVTRKDLDKCMSYSPKVLKLKKKKRLPNISIMQEIIFQKKLIVL